MKKLLSLIVGGFALRLEELPAFTLFIDNLLKVDELVITVVVNTLVHRLGVDISNIGFDNGEIRFSYRNHTYSIFVKTLPLKSGKGYFLRSLQNSLRKHDSENTMFIIVAYPLSEDKEKDFDESIVELLTKKGLLLKKPILCGGRPVMVYGFLHAQENFVQYVDDEVVYESSGNSEKEANYATDEDKLSTPGLLYFRRDDANPQDIMDALTHEGKVLSDLMKKRSDAVKVLGERGLSVVSNADIATHRLYIADLSGGFNDFVAEVSRLKGEGLWDDSVKEVVKAFIKEYERLGIRSDAINEALAKHNIDITV